MRVDHPKLQQIFQWPWILGCGLSNNLPHISRPSSKVEGGNLLSRSSLYRASCSRGSWHGRVSQYHCEHSSGGPGRRSGASCTCISPNRTKDYSQSQSIYQLPGNDACYTQYRLYSSKIITRQCVAISVHRGPTYIPRSTSLIYCILLEPPCNF